MSFSMLRLARIAICVAVGLGVLPFAVSSEASGLNFGVSTCGPAAGHSAAFACDRNDGADKYVGSFVAPFAVPKLLGMTAAVLVCFPTNTLPDWWRLYQAGSCRQTSASADFVSPPGTCVDYWSTAGGATGGLVGYWPAANGFELWIDGVVDSAQAGPIVRGTEYFVFRLTVDHAGSSGAGACAGCDAPGSILFAGLTLHRMGDYDIGFGNADRSNVVTWQGGGNGCYALPVRNRTWGAIKSLYR